MKTVAALALVGGIVLAVPAARANAEGNVLTLETQSGRVACRVTSISYAFDSSSGVDSVACQGGFDQQGEVGSDGRAQHSGNSVGTDADGKIRWFSANMAYDDTYLKMEYGQKYTWGNWTIHHDRSGTRFMNTRTGHGMFVSIANVYGF